MKGWRQLCLTHEPCVRSREAGQLVTLLSGSFSGDPIARIEAFEKGLRWRLRCMRRHFLGSACAARVWCQQFGRITRVVMAVYWPQCSFLHETQSNGDIRCRVSTKFFEHDGFCCKRPWRALSWSTADGLWSTCRRQEGRQRRKWSMHMLEL